MEFVHRTRKASIWLVVAIGLSSCWSGCEKKAPPDQHLVEGYRLLEADPRKALGEFENARNKQDPNVLLGQGLAYEGVRDYAKAEQTLENARKLDPKTDISVALSRVRVMLGKLDEARKDIDASTARAPFELPALLLETCLASDRNRAQSALKHLESWPTQQQSKGISGTAPTEYHLARAVLLRQLGNPEEARKAEDTASKVGLRSDSVAVALASVAYRAGRRDLAVRVLERLADESPSGAIRRQMAVLSHALGAHTLTGRVLPTVPEDPNDNGQLLRLRAEHDFATIGVTGLPIAVASLRRAIAATADDTTSAQLQIMLAEALVRTGETTNARSVLEELLKKQPKCEGAQLGLARMDLIEGKTAAVMTRLSPLVSENGHTAVHELLASAELQAKRYDEALQHLREVVRQAPGNDRALTALVGLELRQKHQQAAVDLVEGQVARYPNDARLWLLLAKVLSETSTATAAEAALRRGLAAIPNEPHLWIALAGEQRRRGSKAEALATLKQAESNNPGSVSIAAAISSILTQMGNSEAALAYYEKVLHLAQDDVGALNNEAMLYADDLHAPDKAVALAERAHRLAPSHPAVIDTLGWALYRRGGKGDLVRARDLLESVGHRLTSPTSKYHLGAVLIASGSPAAGKQLLRVALATSEEFPEAAAAEKLLSAAP